MDPIRLGKSFYQFVSEVKCREEKSGNHYAKGMKDIELLASLEWQHMVGDDRKIYAEKARLFRKTEEYLKATGKMSKREKSGKELININDTVSENGTDDQIMAEEEQRKIDRDNVIKALKWNLGVHLLGEIEKIPIEYRKKIADKIKETHKIFIDNNPSDECRDDYENVVNEIKSFCSNQERNQFRLYTPPHQLATTRKCLNFLAEHVGYSKFHLSQSVSNIDDLYFILKLLKIPDTKLSDVLLIGKLINEIQLDTHSSWLCTYHSKCLSNHCSLAICKKACYYLFNGLKDVYDVKFNEKRFPELQKKLRFMKAPTVENESVQVSVPVQQTSTCFLSTAVSAIPPVRYPPPPPVQLEYYPNVAQVWKYGSRPVVLAPVEAPPTGNVEPIAKPRSKSFCSILMDQKRAEAYQKKKLDTFSKKK